MQIVFDNQVVLVIVAGVVVVVVLVALCNIQGGLVQVEKGMDNHTDKMATS